VAVPNVSEGRDPQAARAIGSAFEDGGGARLLDVHADPDHNRAVFTLAGRQGELATALVAGARAVLARVDVAANDGVHPHVGAIDVVPVVHLVPEQRGAACAEALVTADLLARELELPVFLYGSLADGRSRAEIRHGGPAELGRRMAAGELAPDFGPPMLHPTGGAALVAARPPLLAFNVELAPPATLEDARRIAARVREGGEDGLPGVRAIGLVLERQGIVQVSTNVEDHVRVPLAAVVEAIVRHAPVGGAEVVGVPPRAAYEGWPADVPLRNRRVLEELLEP
jgi:glutamate formiminotransferase / 5-formyltetrahydrofolate cyclo-ligase